MLKILIVGIVALPKVKIFLSCISDSLHQKLPYTIVSTIIAPFPELQEEDLMARMVQKKLVALNINVYSGQSGKPWSMVKEVFYYNSKPYISESIWADLLEKNHDNPLARYFGVKKTFELLICKYYWLKMRTNGEKYI